MNYSRAASLEELHRLAWAANDRAMLEVIELAEDACGIEAERVRERRADKLCDARGVTELRAKLDEATARTLRAEERAREADRLVNAVHFALREYGKPGAKGSPPKWAAYLAGIALNASRRLGVY